MATNKKRSLSTSSTLLIAGIVLVIVGLISAVKTDDLTDGPEASDVKTNLTTGGSESVNTNRDVPSSRAKSQVYSEGRATFAWSTDERPAKMLTEEEVRSLKKQNQTPTVKSLAQ